MDVTSLYLFTEAAKDLHFTKTAERLYISQQTLSNHIARLEKHYGTKLMNRMPSPSLTPAGAIVLEHARNVCEGDANVMRMIAETKNGTRGRIRLGASTMRACSCLPSVLPAFYAVYPNVSVDVINGTTPQLEKLVENGDVDLAITVDANPNNIEVKHLIYDQIYLSVTRSLIERVYGDETDALIARLGNRARLEELTRIPYCMLTNRVSGYLQRAFHSAGFEPNIILSVSNIRIGIEASFNDVAAAFLTKASLGTDLKGAPDDLIILPVYCGDDELALDLSLANQLGRYQPAYVQELARLIEEHYYNAVRKPSISS